MRPTSRPAHKVKEVQKNKEDLLNREQNTRTGYVYIVSNIGAGGEQVYHSQACEALHMQRCTV